MKIGIIRLSSLGDVVLATAVLKVLRQTYPRSEIVFIVRSQYAGVLKNNSYLSRVIEWKEGESFKALAFGLRKEDFDVLIDLHSNARSRSLTVLSGAKRVITYKKNHVSRRLALLRKSKPPGLHVVDRYLDAVKLMGVDTSGAAPAMRPDVDDIVWADGFLLENGYSGGLVVGIAPGARRKTKMWPAQKFAEIANELISSKNLSVVMVGDEADAEVGNKVLEGSAQVINAIGQTDIGRLSALLSRCDAVVSNDSAPAHIAAAVKTPAAIIFGPTIEEFGFAPYGGGGIAISRDLYCRPCSLHGTVRCPEGHFRCMEEIGSEEVFEAVEKILEEAPNF